MHLRDQIIELLKDFDPEIPVVMEPWTNISIDIDET